MNYHGVDDLLATAQRARTAYDWEEAAACYTQALSLPDLTPEQKFDLHDARALCNWYLAEYQLEHDDLVAMVELGKENDNQEWVLEGLTRQAIALDSMGEIEESRHVAERARRAAEEASLPYYRAQAQYALGQSHATVGEFERGRAFVTIVRPPGSSPSTGWPSP